jgi:putative NADH-flavin reductase
MAPYNHSKIVGGMMKLAIFGATGRTGRHLVKQALQRDYEVIAFTRSPEKLPVNIYKLTVVQGDVKNADKVKQAIAGVHAVLSALGPTENKPVFAVTEGTQHILDAMHEHRVERLVLSAGAGVEDPNDKPQLFNHAINFLLKLFSGWVYEDMQRTVEAVRESEVKWTVVRVPMLTDDEPRGEVKVGYVGKGMGPRLTRADMARFMLDRVESEEFAHQAPAISN